MWRQKQFPKELGPCHIKLSSPFTNAFPIAIADSHSKVQTPFPLTLTLFLRPFRLLYILLHYFSNLWNYSLLLFLFHSPSPMAFRTIVFAVMITILLEIQICLPAEISRADFPHGFVFGTASSAFQVSYTVSSFRSSKTNSRLFLFILFWFFSESNDSKVNCTIIIIIIIMKV